MATPRILIVGGVAGGASAATRARRMNEAAEIVIFEKGEHVSFANCGLPYHISGRIPNRGQLLVAGADDLWQKYRIEVRTRNEVTRIDRANQQVEVLDLASGNIRQERYDKLILATGATPVVPPWEGATSSNVFTLRDLGDMDRIKAYLETQRPARAVIIGAGFIGLEMVETLVECGLKVSLVELEPQVLPPLDAEMAREVEEVLREKGVALHLGVAVENLILDDSQAARAAPHTRVNGVRLVGGREIPADLVLLSIGVRPNVHLAAEAGLKIGSTRAIAVNAHLQTSDPDIYAVGDAAEVMHAVTGVAAWIPLAGPANRNGRLAGEHAATGQTGCGTGVWPVDSHWRAAGATPVAGTAIVGLFGRAAAVTGLSARAAAKAGRPHEAAYAIRAHHAGYYPGAESMILKLVFDPGTRRVLGGQAVGGAGIDKRIDVIATAIHFGGTIDDLAGLDLAYAPQFGSAKDPLHIAAFNAMNQADGHVRQIAPGQPLGEGKLIDVRSEAEFAAGSLPGAINIPLPELRERAPQPNGPLTVFCAVGQRGYVAARILVQRGFREVVNLAGGYRLHKPGVRIEN